MPYGSIYIPHACSLSFANSANSLYFYALHDQDSTPRIVKLGETPAYPCGGTHVSDISEITSITVRIYIYMSFNFHLMVNFFICLTCDWEKVFQVC